MAEERQRDRSIERLLEQGAGAPVARAASPDCADAETLAAWTAGAVRHAEAARIERHVADCARCQTMLAVFARTEPAAPASDAWWRRWHLRWLVPIATAATVAAIWVAVPDRDPAVREPAEFTQRPDREPRPASRAPLASPQAPAPPAVDQKVTGARDSARQVEQKAEANEKRPPRREDRGADRDQSKARDNLVAVAPSSDATRAPKPPQALDERVTVAAESAPARQAQTRVVEIVSADGSARWRVIGGDQVERSTSAGARWERVAIVGPAILTAGHSPAPSIAWLVGHGGAIYVTADGSQFDRVPFAASADLVSVVALDERQAIVTTADGRQYSTTDRGASWTRR